MQVVAPTFITKKRETRSTGTDWQHSRAEKNPGDTISAFLSDARNGLFYQPCSPPHFRESEERQTDIFLPLLATVTQSLSIVLRELKAMD